MEDQVHTFTASNQEKHIIIVWVSLFSVSGLAYLSLFDFSPTVVDCGDPGTLTNGQRSLPSTTYNSVVTYTCDVGYTLQGSNSRTCQSDGQWSGSVSQCISELINPRRTCTAGLQELCVCVWSGSILSKQ